MWALTILHGLATQGLGGTSGAAGATRSPGRRGSAAARRAAQRPVSGLFLRTGSVYNFAWQILTWRPHWPLLPKFSGTSLEVPNRSPANAATACHSVHAVDFAPTSATVFLA